MARPQVGFEWGLDTRTAVALEMMAEGVCFLDEELRVQAWNRGAERLTGFDRAEMEGKTLEQAGVVFADETATLFKAHVDPLGAVMTERRREGLRMFARHKEGYWLPVLLSGEWLAEGRGHVLTFRDETARPAEDFGAMEGTAAPLIDSQTGLVTQEFLEQRIAEEIARLRFNDGSAVLIGWMIDHFDSLGSRYGAEFQQEAVRVVARSLANSLRPADILASAGDDGMIFALLRNCLPEHGKSAAERCRALVATTRVQAEGREVWITVSAGVSALRPRDSAELAVDRVVWRLREQDVKERNLLLTC